MKGICLVTMLALVMGLTSCKKTEEQLKDATNKAGGTLKTAADQAEGAVKDMADTAKKLTVDGVDLGADFGKWVDSIKETLNGVKDSETAQAAATKLKESETKLTSLLGMVEKLPAAAKPAFAGIVKTALTGLQELADKVNAIPGAGEHIKPVLDGIIAKLQTIAGS